MVIDFAWCIGKLSADKKKLTIVSPSDDGDAYFMPSQSVVIYGETDLKKLRDMLIEAYPLDK